MRGQKSTLNKGSIFVRGNLDSRFSQAEKGHNGLARMAANDWNNSFGRIFLSSEALNKGFGTNDVEGSDTKEALRVEDVGLLHDFCRNWDSRVDWVGDDENICLGAKFCNPLDQVANDTCVDLEEVITGHARLAWLSVSEWTFHSDTVLTYEECQRE